MNRINRVILFVLLFSSVQFSYCQIDNANVFRVMKENNIDTIYCYHTNNDSLLSIDYQFILNDRNNVFIIEQFIDENVDIIKYQYDSNYKINEVQLFAKRNQTSLLEKKIVVNGIDKFKYPYDSYLYSDSLKEITYGMQNQIYLKKNNGVNDSIWILKNEWNDSVSLSTYFNNQILSKEKIVNQFLISKTIYSPSDTTIEEYNYDNNGEKIMTCYKNVLGIIKRIKIYEYTNNLVKRGVEYDLTSGMYFFEYKYFDNKLKQEYIRRSLDGTYIEKDKYSYHYMK